MKIGTRRQRRVSDGVLSSTQRSDAYQRKRNAKRCSVAECRPLLLLDERSKKEELRAVVVMKRGKRGDDKATTACCCHLITEYNAKRKRSESKRSWRERLRRREQQSSKKADRARKHVCACRRNHRSMRIMYALNAASDALPNAVIECA